MARGWEVARADAYPWLLALDSDLRVSASEHARGEARRAERYAAKLREAGIDPDAD